MGIIHFEPDLGIIYVQDYNLISYKFLQWEEKIKTHEVLHMLLC